MPYLYETHCHGSQCSRCALSTTREIVRAYHRVGYTGLVLTDHFIFGNTTVDPSLPWRERMERYDRAYLEAREEAAALDFDVIFGFEHNYGNGKEVLVYGIGLDFLLAHPEIPTLSLDAFVAAIHEAGGVVIQAHPYRDRPYVNMAVGPRADLVDGIEIYNACDLPGEDRQALALAQTDPRYILTSGGDIHSCEDRRIGAAGIWLPHRVKNEREFAAALKQRTHAFQVEYRAIPQVRASDLP